jgi:regulator of replication initiation timing
MEDIFLQYGIAGAALLASLWGNKVQHEQIRDLHQNYGQELRDLHEAHREELKAVTQGLVTSNEAMHDTNKNLRELLQKTGKRRTPSSDPPPSAA